MIFINFQLFLIDYVPLEQYIRTVHYTYTSNYHLNTVECNLPSTDFAGNRISSRNIRLFDYRSHKRVKGNMGREGSRAGFKKYSRKILNLIVCTMSTGLVPVVLLSVFNYLIYVSISRATVNHNNISSAHRWANYQPTGEQINSPQVSQLSAHRWAN